MNSLGETRYFVLTAEYLDNAFGKLTPLKWNSDFKLDIDLLWKRAERAFQEYKKNLEIERKLKTEKKLKIKKKSKTKKGRSLNNQKQQHPLFQK